MAVTQLSSCSGVPELMRAMGSLVAGFTDVNTGPCPATNAPLNTPGLSSFRPSLARKGYFAKASCCCAADILKALWLNRRL